MVTRPGDFVTGRRGVSPPCRTGTTPAMPIRTCLVNDYEVIVRGLRDMLAPYSDRVEIVETEVDSLPDGSADVVLFDTFAARRSSLERVERLALDRRFTRIVLYSWDVPKAFRSEIDAADLDGVIPKSVRGSELVASLERIHDGERVGLDLHCSEEMETALTEREREVLALVARGRTNREIARELYLSVDTVKTHLQRLYRKLDVTNRTQAALAADRHGLRLAGRPDLGVPRGSG